MDVQHLATAYTYSCHHRHTTVTHHHPTAPGLGRFHSAASPALHRRIEAVREYIDSRLEERVYRVGEVERRYPPVLCWFAVYHDDLRPDLGTHYMAVVQWGQIVESVYGDLPHEHAQHIARHHQRIRRGLGLQSKPAPPSVTSTVPSL